MSAQLETPRAAQAGRAAGREEIENFLYHEAELLDDWQLAAWEALFTEDGRYEVAPISLDKPETLDPSKVLFLVADDRARLKQRTLRLMKKSAHAEYPHSRTRHLVSNIRFQADGDEILTRSVFVVYRIRREEVMTYMGQNQHRLRRVDGALQIVSKRACLDLETLKPQGTVSIIL
jgi:p-cumate 2,3-dioxygenase beta subunit